MNTHPKNKGIFQTFLFPFNTVGEGCHSMFCRKNLQVGLQPVRGFEQRNLPLCSISTVAGAQTPMCIYCHTWQVLSSEDLNSRALSSNLRYLALTLATKSLLQNKSVNPNVKKVITHQSSSNKLWPKCACKGLFFFLYTFFTYKHPKIAGSKFKKSSSTMSKSCTFLNGGYKVYRL